MSEKKNIPEIRFKGFEGKWKEEKLEGVVDVKSGRDYKHLTIGKIPVYGTGGYMLSVSEALSYDEDAIGIGRKGTIDKPYILKAPFWTVDTLFYAIPKEDNNLDFIYDIFQKIDWKQKNEATGVPSLSKVSINSIRSFFPKIDEQTKIGTYFQKLDKLIALHQVKYNKLLSIKKAMLEKMFPKDGADVPEIRFKGFEGKWEKNILGELTDIYDGTHQTPNYTENGVMFLSVENIKTLKSEKYISDEAFKKEFKISPQKGDVLMTRIGDIGTANVVESNEPKAYYVSLALFKCKKLNPYFLKESISSESVTKELWHRTLHIAFPKKINKNEIAKVAMFYPNIEEQSKIGTYFQKFNNLISLHQKELEKLKHIKKACLEKMFV